MADHANLTRLAKRLAKEMAGDGIGLALLREMQSLNDTPEFVLEVIDLMAKAGTAKRPSEDLIAAYSMLLGQGLASVRLAVEAGDKGAGRLADRVREHIIDGGESGRIVPPIVLLILHRFASAKLEMGDDLRDLIQDLMADDEVAREAVENGAGADFLVRLARDLEHDAFAIYAQLEEGLEAMPEDHRSAIVEAALADAEPSLHEAALGFVLNGSATVRAQTAQEIARRAKDKLITPTMLRRMIAMRNWLPAPEQRELDKAIAACRKAGIACATLRQPQVHQVLTSGVDGAGSQTLFIISEIDGAHAASGVLLKNGHGVSDAWVRRGGGASQVRELLDAIEAELEMAPTTIRYAEDVLRHFLAVNDYSGNLPPFGLVDVAEAAGLADLNPVAITLEALIEELVAGIEPAELTEAAVTRTLLASRTWPDDVQVLASWYEADVQGIVGGKGGARGKQAAKQLAALLTGPLQKRRRYWAGLSASMAYALRHQPEGDCWQGFAIVAHELLGARPIEQIGLMHAIAETSMEAARMERLLGPRFAA